MSALGQGELPLLRAAAALAAVLLLAVAALWLLRRSGVLPAGADRPAGRLGVVAAQTIDRGTRLVLVRRDGVEHLLVVSPGGVTLIETLPTTAAPPALLEATAC